MGIEGSREITQAERKTEDDKYIQVHIARLNEGQNSLTCEKEGVHRDE
jgi:hypothetical protein